MQIAILDVGHSPIANESIYGICVLLAEEYIQ